MGSAAIAGCGAAWVFAVVVLVGVGSLLSRTVSDRVSRAVGDVPGWMARSYRLVLWVLCLLFCTAVPVLLALAVSLTVVVVRWMLAHDVDAKPIALVVLVGVLSVVSIGRGLLVRAHPNASGLELALDRFPELRDVVERASRRAGTKLLDRFSVTPGAELHVVATGGLLRQLGPQRTSTLVVGLGLLDGLRVIQFEALLASELAYRTGTDLAGGALVLAVRQAVARATMDLAVSGTASALSPSWVVLRMFDASLRSAAEGAVALQAAAADRRAVLAYGASTLEGALVHHGARADRFTRMGALAGAMAHARTVASVHQDQLSVARLATEHASLLLDETALARAMAAARDAMPDTRESGAAATERVERLRGWALVTGEKRQDLLGDRPAWSLFPDRAALPFEVEPVPHDDSLG